MTYIPQAHFTITPIGLGGVHQSSVGSQFLHQHRTRVDQIKLLPKTASCWRHHSGHEFILVTQGTLRVELAETEGGAKTSYDLDAGDALAVPSSLFTAAKNLSDQTTIIVVSRPTLAKEVAFGQLEAGTGDPE